MEGIVEIVSIVIVAEVCFALCSVTLSKKIKRAREGLIKDIIKAIKDKNEKTTKLTSHDEKAESRFPC